MNFEAKASERRTDRFGARNLVGCSLSRSGYESQNGCPRGFIVLL